MQTPRVVIAVGPARARRPLFRSFAVSLLGGCLALLLTGCHTVAPQSMNWHQRLASELPALGHRNWIVIADAAYPAQVSPGIETIATGASQLEVVEAVLKALGGTRHVQPIVHLDAELAAVPESLAPGVERYRQRLDALLTGRRVVREPHEEIIKSLDEAGRTFRVLLLKTDLTIPYTSVFMQLDCGYWGPEPEKQLREILKRGQ